MGNNCTHQQTEIGNHTNFTASSKGHDFNFGCAGCFINHGHPYGVDYAELQTHNHEMIPMGKISLGSISYLQKDEISFLKACAGKNISALRYFTKKGVNVNLLDEDRTSPLHVASRSGSLQVVEELINSGATINMADMAGWTSLHVAAYNQRHLICHLLLKKGADPYLTTRQGETPWDMVRERATEEIFLSHFDKAEIRKMSNLKKEDPFIDVNDEYIILSEYRPRDTTARTKIEVKETIPKGGSIGKKFRNELEEIDENNLQKENRKSLGENTLSPYTFPTVQHHRFTTTEEPMSEKKGHGFSMIPKKHKYYVYFKKMKAQHLSTFRENRDLLNTLNSEGSSEDGEQLFDYSYNNEYMPYSPKHNKAMIKTQDLGLDDVYGTKSGSYQNNLGDLPLVVRKIESITNANRQFNTMDKKSARLIPPLMETKSQTQLLPNNQKIPSYQTSVNNSFARVSSVSRIEKSVANISILPLVNPTISIYKLFYKDPKESILSKIDIDQVSIGDHIVDLWLFEIEEKYKDMIYKLGIELFNYDGTMGLSFLILFKFIRQSVKDIALFLFSDETQGSIKKSLSERTNFLANVQVRECLDILQHFSAFFNFDEMTFIEALRLYLSGFVIENNPEKIDWLLRGFARRYFKMIRKLIKNAQPLPDKQKFETAEAVRMMAFTLVMLDIEINHQEKDTELPNYEDIRKELHVNLAGINDGENFNPNFINGMFEEIKREKLIKYIGHNDVNNKAKLSFKFARLMVRGFRNSKKTKNSQKEYLLYFSGPVCFVVKFMGEKSVPKGLFMLNGCKIDTTENGKSVKMIISKNDSQNLIPFVHFKSSGMTIINFKQEVGINLTSSNDVLRIKEHLKSLI